MNPNVSRRQFLQRASLTAAGVWIGQSSFGKISPNEKLNIAAIGTANRAAADIHPCAATENIVALCDVDSNYLAAAKARYPGAKTYTDYRKMLEQNDIDAVIVGTPDHMHAVATVAALKSGRHVYCEKPLTHTVSEARIVAETAKKHGMITQMGNQIHASNNYHRVVESIQAGVIGAVREVHVFVDVIYTANARPAGAPVPATLDWEQWVGPAQFRPYSPSYVPAAWRNYWEFGGGTMSDFGCHYMDLPFWALNLRHPTSVETEGPPVNAEGTPIWMKAIYEFPQRGILHPVKMTWYHGQKDGQFQRPSQFADLKLPETHRRRKINTPSGSGVLFVGEKGMLLSEYFKHTLFAENDANGRLIEVPGNDVERDHHQQWIHAIKNGGTPLSNFDYAGALTESVLLANASYRSSSKINWDPANLTAVNNAKAQEFIQHQYRKGWSL